MNTQHHFFINGTIGKDYTSANLLTELDKAKGRDLLIDIDSIGGDFDVGVSIWAHLRRYSQNNQATITTRSSGFVASIATVIFLAGDVRVVNEFMQPFIHEPLMVGVDANKMTPDEIKAIDDAREILADFYSSNCNVSKKQAFKLMRENTWLRAEECIEMDFATEIEVLSRNKQKIVAQLKTNFKTNEMSKQNSNAGLYKRLIQVLGVGRSAQLELASVDEKTIVFPNLTSEDKPSVEDEIVVDEDTNFTGEVETADYIILVEDGKVTEVFDKTEITEEEIIETLLDKVDELEAKLEAVEKEKKRIAKLYDAIGSKGGNVKGGRNNQRTDANDKGAGRSALERIRNKKKQ